jgi:8-oxo-dGTP pyrophosphatase MutT (NUDIX family)
VLAPPGRVPFYVGRQRAGSVARQHLVALQAWPQLLRVAAGTVHLHAAPAQRTAALAHVNAALREQGLVCGWRNETFAITGLRTGALLASTERAACRFWGSLTVGVHANGYQASDQGRPTHLWIAQRSASKATDPGLRDNLVGGGVPQGQSPLQALLREAWEEAGLQPRQVRQGLHTGPVLRISRAVPEGWQLEDVHCFDLRLPERWVPANQDGEVQGFACLPVAEALALARSGAMTVDAARVTLNFLQRHGLAGSRA